MFYALISINNHIFSSIIGMLSTRNLLLVPLLGECGHLEETKIASCLSLPFFEAEIWATANVSFEKLQISSFLHELGFLVHESMPMNYDNKSAILKVKILSQAHQEY